MRKLSNGMPVMPRRRALAILGSSILGTVAAESLMGCGTGMKSLAQGRGAVSFTLTWPSSILNSHTRLVPAATQSVKVSLTTTGSTPVPPQILTPPASGTTSTVTFPNVPIGSTTVTAEAYPTTIGEGTPLASSTSLVQVQQGQTATVTLLMDSTVHSVSVLAAKTQLAIGEAQQLVATATDVSGNTVFIAPAQWSWVSSSLAVAVVQGSGVDNTAQVTGQAVGNVSITASYTETVPPIMGTLDLTIGTTTTNPNGLGSTTVGNSPSAVATNATTNRVYVANYGDSTVTVIDGTDLGAIATVSVGFGPVAIAVNSGTGNVYVLNNGGTSPTAWSITVLDGNTNKVITTVYNITGSSNGSGGSLAVNSVTGMVYATTGSNIIYGIMGGTNTIARVISVSGVPAQFGLSTIGVNSSTGAFFAGAVGNLYDFNSNGQLVTSFYNGAIEAVAVSVENNLIYAGAGVPGGFFGSLRGIIVVDGTTNTVIGNYSFSASHLAFNDNKNELIILQAGFGSSLLVLNVSQSKIVTSVSLNANPTCLAVNPTTGIIYITLSPNTLMAVQG